MPPHGTLGHIIAVLAAPRQRDLERKLYFLDRGGQEFSLPRNLSRAGWAPAIPRPARSVSPRPPQAGLDARQSLARVCKPVQGIQAGLGSGPSGRSALPEGRGAGDRRGTPLIGGNTAQLGRLPAAVQKPPSSSTSPWVLASAPVQTRPRGHILHLGQRQFAARRHLVQEIVIDHIGFMIERRPLLGRERLRSRNPSACSCRRRLHPARRRPDPAVLPNETLPVSTPIEPVRVPGSATMRSALAEM